MVVRMKKAVIVFVGVFLLLDLFLVGSVSAWTRNITMEDNVVESDSYDSAFDSVYHGGSDAPFYLESSIVHSGSRSCRIEYASNNDGPSLVVYETVPVGGDVWWRMYIYLPSGWQWGPNWVKGLRTWYSEGHGTYFGWHASGSIVIMAESPSARYDQNMGNDFTSTGDNTWHSYEYYVGNVGTSNQIHRGWIDGVLVLEEIGIAHGVGSSVVDFRFMDTWNNGAPQSQTCYIDDIIITTDTPSNQDVYGNYMIGPSGGSPSNCGNGNCDSGECDTCSQDCDFNDCCNDGVCNNGETFQTCSNDCSCTESWTCTEWGSCSNEIQTRTCTDENYCGTENDKPSETQNCGIGNNECDNWQSEHPEWITCEDWDSDTPPSGWPECAGASWNGWTPKDYDCEFGTESGFSDHVFASTPRSYHQVRSVGDAGVMDLSYSFAPQQKIHLAMNLLFSESFVDGEEELVHFIFFNTARAWVNFGIDLWLYTDYQPEQWPPLCVGPGGLFFGFHSYHNTPDGTENQDGYGPTSLENCWNIGSHENEWHHVEFMWDLENNRVRMWIDGDLKTDRTMYSSNHDFIDLIILSGWNSCYGCGADDSQDFYVDDIVISTERIGYSGGSSCGNGTCDAGECNTCPQDCSLQDCQDGTCQPAVGEDCSNSADCPCTSQDQCCSGTCQTPACSHASDCGSNPCMTYTCSNPGTCSASCSSVSVAVCTNGDGCCPSGCAFSNDNDCPSGGTVTETWGDSQDSDHTRTIQDTFLNQGEWGLDINSDNTQIEGFTWPADVIATTILMRFDLSEIPPSATITDARLQLYQFEWDTDHDNSYRLTAHKIINHDPVFSEANGFYYSGSSQWTAVTPSGSYYENRLGYLCCNGDTPLALNDIGPVVDTIYSDRTEGYKTWDITHMVRDWVTSASENHGLLIVPEDYTEGDSHRFFYSSEYSDATRRPKLVVTYSTQGYHRADADPQNGCIDENELVAFIGLWKGDSTEYPMREMMEGIALWKSGAGCNP